MFSDETKACSPLMKGKETATAGIAHSVRTKFCGGFFEQRLPARPFCSPAGRWRSRCGGHLGDCWRTFVTRHETLKVLSGYRSAPSVPINTTTCQTSASTSGPPGSVILGSQRRKRREGTGENTLETVDRNKRYCPVREIGCYVSGTASVVGRDGRVLMNSRSSCLYSTERIPRHSKSTVEFGRSSMIGWLLWSHVLTCFHPRDSSQVARAPRTFCDGPSDWGTAWREW